MSLTDKLDLRGGQSCWRPALGADLTGDPFTDAVADVAIIGAGVMGSMLAERLTADGRSVVVLDRRHPAHGATAASTALVMWGSDIPLTHLARTLGDAEAARRWRRVHAAVTHLDGRIAALGLDCGWRARPEVYLAGDVLDDEDLRTEGQARAKAGLPSTYLTAEQTAARFGVAPRSALVSDDAYEVDPVALSLGLLDLARRRGARLHFPVDVVNLAYDSDGVGLDLADGRRVAARQVILASGYELAQDHVSSAFTLGSSFAFATAPGVAPQWAENAMIWEASDPYLYGRATRDGRVIVGGEDEDFVDAEKRDALIPSKAKQLAKKAEARFDCGPLTIDCAWAATFGSSPDGLPAIGRSKVSSRVWVANGLGGNGVTFAMLAADLISADLLGAADPVAAGFDPYRFDGAPLADR